MVSFRASSRFPENTRNSRARKGKGDAAAKLSRPRSPNGGVELFGRVTCRASSFGAGCYRSKARGRLDFDTNFGIHRAGRRQAFLRWWSRLRWLHERCAGLVPWWLPWKSTSPRMMVATKHTSQSHCTAGLQDSLVKAGRRRLGWWHCKQAYYVQISMEFTLGNCTASSSVYTRSVLTFERPQGYLR